MPELLRVVTAVPPNVVDASAVKAELSLHLKPADVLRFSRIVDGTRVRKRYTVVPVADLLRLKTVEERNNAYTRHALALGERVGRDALAAAKIDPRSTVAVVSVSCTGHMMPSLDAHLINHLGLSPTVRRIPITELGCCAGVGAVALASTLLAQVGSGTALVVTVELSTLGMQVAEPSMTDMVANLLFGDGAAAVVLAAENSGRGPEILASQSMLWPDTLDHLGMKLTDTGFRLVLSSELPKVARAQLGPALAQFLAHHRLCQDDIGFWIVHPGGPKVLEAVGAALNLSERALQPSWETWEQFGNLSSANVFFVLHHLQKVAPPLPGKLGLMLALGPGIACEMVLLRAGGWLAR